MFSHVMYLWCQLQVEQRQEIQRAAVCTCRVLACCGIMDPVGSDPDRDGCPAGDTPGPICRDASAFCCKCVCFKRNPVIQVTAVPSRSPKRRDSHITLSPFIMCPLPCHPYHNCKVRLLSDADAKDLYLVVLISD